MYCGIQNINSTVKGVKMKEYKDIVEQARKERSINPISNSSFNHALIVIENLFEMAIEDKIDIKIVSGCLQNNFYENLIPKAQNILDLGCRIDVITLCPIEALEHNKFKHLLNNYNTQTSILCLKEKEEAPSIPHFMLVGKTGYRIEFNDENKIAEGCFNNELVGNFLEEQFCRLKENENLFKCH